MSETVMLRDVDGSKTDGRDQAKKAPKRKRETSALISVTSDQKESQIKALNEEVQGLFRFYREMLDEKPVLESVSSTSRILALMEEKSLPFEKLVEEIHGKVKEKEEMENVTMAMVRSAVLSSGRRVMYGVPNADADILNDDTESCLWCWEEKEQKRLLEEAEKERAELRKQRAIQKQASIMERFLKKSTTTSSSHAEQSCSKATLTDPSNRNREIATETVTQSMDCALFSDNKINVNDLRKLHLSSWHHLGNVICSNSRQCWGVRQKPKTELFKELKLSTNRVITHDDEFNIDGLAEKRLNDRSCTPYSDSLIRDVKNCKRRKQLLQFDKSHRPAFYGIWPKKSQVVGPRNPLRKDPDLDYDVDSDEEWEEEEPGESLSDCDKDEEESMEEGFLKADDEDECADGFFVPDGYLSENELILLVSRHFLALTVVFWFQVSLIQSCSQGINKVVDSLQQKFPDISRSQLRNKVREISDFADNRWQVKKEILIKLGFSTSPSKGGGRTKSIAAFFSKRCMPPSDASINPMEVPRQSLKPGIVAVSIKRLNLLLKQLRKT
ncbi:chromatin assembly factor 1 subunit FAS1 [Carica papaya]|uniref:chromatin assembly factor 1 subunit FAS1 n=1 Tax=Carica papaya TaxID=3649 RepID=UPI000B8D0195|nr:chromatin assembly factor 1 subunit FAS1 [Carica papaya]